MTKLFELARLINAELIGARDAEVTRARPFELASEGDVTLALDPVFVARINESRATAIIVSASTASSTRKLLVTRDPKLAFAREMGT